MMFLTVPFVHHWSSGEPCVAVGFGIPCPWACIAWSGSICYAAWKILVKISILRSCASFPFRPPSSRSLFCDRWCFFIMLSSNIVIATAAVFSSVFPATALEVTECSCGFQDERTASFYTDSIVLYFNETDNIDPAAFWPRTFLIRKNKDGTHCSGSERQPTTQESQTPPTMALLCRRLRWCSTRLTTTI